MVGASVRDMATFSPDDLVYITTEYRTVPELCDEREWTAAQVRDLVAAGRLPAPTYVLPSGEERVPPDYFALPDEFGLPGLAAGFRARHQAAGGTADEAEEDWQGYLSGQFGVCLRAVTPEAMVAKTRAIARIVGLTSAPRPDDEAWRDDLRTAVDDLDTLLRPFTDFDRARWGDVSRDQHIARVRQAWPAVFGGE